MRRRTIELWLTAAAMAVGTAMWSKEALAGVPGTMASQGRLFGADDKPLTTTLSVRFALYDLQADPREADDLMRKRPDLAAEMKALYKETSARIVESPPRGGIPTHER